MSNYIINDNGIDREATKSEIADIEARHAQALLEQEAEKDKAAARVSALAKLEALGLTPAEVAALVG